MIARNDDWPEKLLAEIESAKTRPFKFGSHDCCMFADRIVLAMTGTSPAKKLKGYTSKVGAYKMLKKNGSGTLLRTMTAVMKEQGCKAQPNANLLRRGDVCMTKIDIALGGKEWAVGICVGSHAAFASDGVAMIPMTEIDRGWHL